MGLGAGETVISRIRCLGSGARFSLNNNDNPVPLSMRDFLGSPNSISEWTLYVQLEDGTLVTSNQLAATTNDRANYAISDSDDQAALNNIASGDSFIVAIARATLAVAHEVDAGGVSWVFDIPEPTVTKVEPVAHTVDAGGVSWAFDIPEPTVTKVEPDAHAVNAGGVSWAFDVPEPTVTKTPSIANLVLQTLDLSDGVFGSSNPWEGAVLVDPVFIAGGGTAYLRFIDRVGNSIQIRLAASTTADPFLAGPEFTDALETYVEAFTFNEVGGGGASIVLKGTNHPDNGFRDSSEPYFWTPDNGSAWAAFWSGITGTTTLTLKVGVAPPHTNRPRRQRWRGLLGVRRSRANGHEERAGCSYSRRWRYFVGLHHRRTNSYSYGPCANQPHS